MDERRGRRLAAQEGTPVIDLLSVVFIARRYQLIRSARALVHPADRAQRCDIPLVNLDDLVNVPRRRATTQSWLEVTNILASEGIVSFWWKVSSEGGYDFLRFSLNGVEQSGGISGNVDWQQRGFPVSSGTNVLRWAYTKDGSVSAGADAGWVDEDAG